MSDAPPPAGRESTRARILSTALGLFAEHGFEGTTVRQIADACDVTERTVYRYFPFKDDLVLAEIRELIPLLRDLTAARPAEERPFVAVWHALKTLQEERPRVMGLLVRDMGERLLDKTSSATRRIVDEFCEGIAAGLLPRVAAAHNPSAEGAGPPPDLAFRARVLASAAISPLLTALRASVELPVDKRSAQSVNALLDEAFAAMENG